MKYFTVALVAVLVSSCGLVQDKLHGQYDGRHLTEELTTPKTTWE